MKQHVLSVLAFVAVTFAVQAMSHFVVNTWHYASVPFVRADPIFPMGFLAMIIQGVALTYLYARLRRTGRAVSDGLKFGLVAGAFFVSFLALVEPARYVVPSIPAWIAVEGLAGLVQFSIYGILLGLIHGTRDEAAA